MPSWTIVTGVFDLTSLPDAVDVLLERDIAHFLRHSTATLTLDQPMVIFCEPKTLDALKARRPEHLHAKTKFIAMEFSEFPLYRYKEQILANRKAHPEIQHNRCNPSYYLLCMARYAMLKRVMEENPFGSTHFAWLNICIERMGPSNVKYLPDVFASFRDKVSTCFIDYVSYKLTLDAPAYYQYGRCSLCSGFFTGRKDYLTRFCDRVEEKFLHYLALGYGHADEQLFAPVFYENREIFEVYYGDYSEMITNYHWIRERAHEPLRLLIQRSFAGEDYTVCIGGCDALWKSFKKGTAVLRPEELSTFLSLYRTCRVKLGLSSELD
jgi:hypothetical protein